MLFRASLTRKILSSTAIPRVIAAINTDTKSIKRESPLEETSQPKRAKQSQDGAFVKLESKNFIKKYNFGDNDDNDVSTAGDEDEPGLVPAQVPAQPLAPAVAQVNEIRQSVIVRATLNRGAQMTKKMNNIHDIYERERTCCAEITSISAELRRLVDMASGQCSISHTAVPIADKEAELLEAGKVKWLFTQIMALTEEKEILRTVLEKTKQKQVRRESKLRKREQEMRLQKQREAERKRQLEAKRLATKQQLKSENGSRVPRVGMTQAPKVIIKMNPNAKAETLQAFKKAESKYIIKKEEDIGNKSKIKLEEERSRQM